MRCPKCSYISFDGLIACGKCGNDLSAISSALVGTVFKTKPPGFLACALELLAKEKEAEEKAAGEESYDLLDLGTDEADLLEIEAEEELELVVEEEEKDEPEQETVEATPEPTEEFTPISPDLSAILPEEEDDGELLDDLGLVQEEEESGELIAEQEAVAISDSPQEPDISPDTNTLDDVDYLDELEDLVPIPSQETNDTDELDNNSDEIKLESLDDLVGGLAETDTESSLSMEDDSTIIDMDLVSTGEKNQETETKKVIPDSGLSLEKEDE